MAHCWGHPSLGRCTSPCACVTGYLCLATCLSISSVWHAAGLVHALLCLSVSCCVPSCPCVHEGAWVFLCLPLPKGSWRPLKWPTVMKICGCLKAHPVWLQSKGPLWCCSVPPSPPGSLRSGHGEMSSSLGGIWSLSPKNRHLQRSCIPDPAHVAIHLSSDHLIGLSITASEQSHVRICAPGQYCMNIFVSGQSYSQMSFIFIYFWPKIIQGFGSVW